MKPSAPPAQLRGADFEAALKTAARAAAARVVDLHRAHANVSAELVTGTAEIALGAKTLAKSFERALAAIQVAVDPATTSPKVLRAFDAARIPGNEAVRRAWILFLAVLLAACAGRDTSWARIRRASPWRWPRLASQRRRLAS
jgi:hypothetical protein